MGAITTLVLLIETIMSLIIEKTESNGQSHKKLVAHIVKDTANDRHRDSS